MHKGNRREASTLWLYGVHAVEAALANPRRNCRRLVGTKAAIDRVTPAMGKRGVKSEVADDRRLQQLLPQGAVHQGIAVEVEALEMPSLDEILDRESKTGRLILVLDQVSDPHNLGAILRSAAAFGADAVVVQDRHSPPLGGVTAKTASGAVDRVPIVEVVNIARALEAIGEAGFTRLGLDEEGAFSLDAQALGGDVAIVLGAEGEGLRRLTRENCDHLVRLPTAPRLPSLNVSNAAAVALYEVTRQRRVKT